MIDPSGSESINFLKIDQYLELIKKQQPSFNIFEILKVETNENIHSNFLAWIFNPELHKNEDGSNIFLLALVKKLEIKVEVPMQGAVCREYCFPNGKRIDLIISLGKIIIFIENKIQDWERPDQLESYKISAKTDSKFKNENLTHYFLFLTPWGTKAGGWGWKEISYFQISEIIKSQINSLNDEFIRGIIESYIHTIEVKVLSDHDIKRKFLKRYIAEPQELNKFKEIIKYIPPESIYKDLKDSLGSYLWQQNEDWGNNQFYVEAAFKALNIYGDSGWTILYNRQKEQKIYWSFSFDCGGDGDIMLTFKLITHQDWCPPISAGDMKHFENLAQQLKNVLENDFVFKAQIMDGSYPEISFSKKLAKDDVLKKEYPVLIEDLGNYILKFFIPSLKVIIDEEWLEE
ncbi:MAG: PD-(D/E)XK nuclease family protein [Candidatus Nitronauta litoralis]|uniref:PD-(D/E)XK nuclease family protein n=1 Tax=Candidatus Nitronauta litoralis TaxID=2705533 RepID=A0A7T0BWS6_9BACT|nr:MAG: PD-(D/E)XK nuclease family protein [Candidatus Nitronauta litoralis]